MILDFLSLLVGHLASQAKFVLVFQVSVGSRQEGRIRDLGFLRQRSQLVEGRSAQAAHCWSFQLPLGFLGEPGVNVEKLLFIVHC